MTRPSTLLSDIARFWARVDRSGDCWIWRGELNNKGYGRFTLQHDGTRSRLFAHRFSLVLSGVDVGEGDVVRHSCDNPPCVNPAHLLLGTQADNMRDAMERGRLNLSGLALAFQRERDCRHCGERLADRRKLVCPPCRDANDRAAKANYAARKRAERGLTADERRALVEEKSA